MKAIVQRNYGSPAAVLALGETAAPGYRGDEVRIRVKAASVNTPDWIAVTGTPYVLRFVFGLLRPTRRIRGTDVAGIVEAVGEDVRDLKVGDEVFGSTYTSDLRNEGSFAELAVAPAEQLVSKPRSLSFEHAAGAVMSGLTAMIAICDVAKVEPGMRVLINGASGGVGLFAVQFAKALGAEVTGVCSTRNLDLVRSAGADHVIDYTGERWIDTGVRYDVVLDNVMNHWPRATMRLLTPGGVLLPNSVGPGGGFFAGLFRMLAAYLRGRGTGRVRFVECDYRRDKLVELHEWLESGRVQVIVDTVYRWEDAARAVEHMARRRARGKIVITMSK